MSDDVSIPPYDPAVQAQIDARANEFNQRWATVHDEAEFEIHHLGFPDLTKPHFSYPELDPQTLTTADLISFSSEYARRQAWFSYAESVLARVESQLITVKRQMEQLHQQLVIEYGQVLNPMTQKVYSAVDRKALAENTPRYIELLRDRTKLEAQQKLMKPRAESISRDCALTSRVIELRKLDMESGRISGNIPNRGTNQGMYPR